MDGHSGIARDPAGRFDRRRLFLGAAAALITAVFLTTAGGVETTDLDDLLRRLARNAAHYRNEALRFSCVETIEWVGWGDAGRGKFGYVYVFDRDTGFEEYRTRYRKKPKKKVRRVRPEEYGIPIHLNNPYLWCFTFRDERQPYHTYSIVGTERLHGIEVVKIRFEPVPPIVRQVNDWFGTAWVDPQEAQLVKVEVTSPEAQAALEALRSGAEITDDVMIVQRITTLFDERLDGLRVPSRVELRGESYAPERRTDGVWTYGKSIHYRVDQRYSDYRLYGVTTKESVGRDRDSR